MQHDFVFFLDEELTSIQLCPLLIEMCNTEQLPALLGFLAYWYKTDSLTKANAALNTMAQSQIFHGDRITAKKKSDQQSTISFQLNVR